MQMQQREGEITISSKLSQIVILEYTSPEKTPPLEHLPKAGSGSFRLFLNTIKGIGVNDAGPAVSGGVKSLTLMPYS